MKFLEASTRNLFFTGKGGVGKTSMACASAISLADAGRRVLLVSTDPASNLDEVLGVQLSSKPTVIPTVTNLWAMNINPELAAAEYRERMVGPYRGVLPDAAVRSMEEQFSGSCTLEIAAFDEFARLVGDATATADFDHIVFDTAPTGHTLRLLTLPSAWSGFMESNTSGTSCLGPLAGLQAQQEMYKQTVEALSNPERTTIMLVTRPDRSAFREAERTSRELRELGVSQQQLIINGVFAAQDTSDEIAVAMEERCVEALASIPAGLIDLPRSTVRLASRGLIGIEALRAIGGNAAESTTAETRGVEMIEQFESLSQTVPLKSLIVSLARQEHGVIFTMGKGGVGKTTVAAAVAVGLAEKGLKVHLSTTDPAAHIAATLASDTISGLTVSRIDPVAETRAYRDEVMQTAGADLDNQGRALLEEDLRSPCTEEIAVFRAFAAAVAAGEDGFVVLDTAPTGHTILLLDSALAYHREVSRQTNQMPESVEKLLPRLRDPDYTRVLVVTLPESTPVHEAQHLQEDLRRAEIEPFAWVINQALSPLTVTDPLLLRRQASELPFFEEAITRHARQTAVIPWQVAAPVGIAGLRSLLNDSSDTPAVEKGIHV